MMDMVSGLEEEYKLVLAISVIAIIAVLAIFAGEETARVVVSELLKVAITILLSFLTAKYAVARAFKKMGK